MNEEIDLAIKDLRHIRTLNDKNIEIIDHFIKNSKKNKVDIENNNSRKRWIDKKNAKVKKLKNGNQLKLILILIG
ncbi:hypothetical protein SNEBB_007543 [Seison nebaliae]|nr:hypothetical protein SNEBB_007543 [Seison nebaliae]